MGTDEQQPPIPMEHGEGITLSRELGGDLPCVMCRYNLRGLSILARCPECGAAVRATILSVVDPHAKELAPIRRPRMLGALLTMWAAGGLVVTLALWVPYARQAMSALGASGSGNWMMTGRLLLVGLACSWAGSLALIRPHGRIATWMSLAAVAGVLLYAPLSWALVEIVWRFDEGAGWDFGRWPPPTQRIVLRLIAGACLAGIVMGLRPSARVLAARSLLLRSGRVDRQTLAALAVAATVGCLGDGLALLSSIGLSPVFGLVGMAFIILSSLLVTVGVVGVAVDTYRIVRAICVPAPTLEQLVDRQDRQSSRASEGLGP